jgi:hypothetical protein
MLILLYIFKHYVEVFVIFNNFANYNTDEEKFCKEVCQNDDSKKCEKNENSIKDGDD